MIAHITSLPRRRAITIAATALTLIAIGVLLALHPDLASAQSGSAGQPKAGESLGKWLQDQAKWIFTGITALVSIFFLVGRRFNEFFVWAVVAVLVGIFVFAPGSVQNLASGVGKLIGA